MKCVLVIVVLVYLDSCTQHGAFELPDHKNGVYARHLLKNIFRDTRIENILMDVSTGKTSPNSDMVFLNPMKSSRHSTNYTTYKLFYNATMLQPED